MIPYQKLGSSAQALHFLHANGYPPAAYQPLLTRLADQASVWAMHMRPLWPGTQPASLPNWLPLADDLLAFLEQHELTNSPANQNSLVGAGHSVGATTTLHLALRKPGLFRALVLIDPVLFPPWMILLWRLIHGLGLAYRIHPLIRSTLRRRNTFDSRQAMFENYRQKPIFKHIPDPGLWAYVDALACQDETGKIQLCYPPEWEAHIYDTAMLCDMPLWRALPGLKTPVLLLRGELTSTFWPATARLFQRKLPAAQVITIPGTTHLLPLEAPETTAGLIKDYLADVL